MNSLDESSNYRSSKLDHYNFEIPYNKMNLEKVKRNIKGKVKFNEPMKNHTSFHIGGDATVYVEPKNLEELKKILFLVQEEALPFFVLGTGSNILVGDNGFDGIIISSENFTSLEIKRRNLHSPPPLMERAPILWMGKMEERGRENSYAFKVTVGSGLKLSSLLSSLAENGLSGLEFLAGIPGTVGGAALMNAGSEEEGIGNFIEKIEIMDFSGKVKNIPKKELKFSYRNANLSKYFFLSKATFKLKYEDSKIIKEKMRNFLKKKRQNQPIEKYSAGCIFKNPPGLFAGKLIEETGLKGKKKGNAVISEKHSNYIINSGKARAEDVLFLMEKIQEKVYKKFNVKLEPEIKII